MQGMASVLKIYNLGTKVKHIYFNLKNYIKDKIVKFCREIIKQKRKHVGLRKCF